MTDRHEVKLPFVGTVSADEFTPNPALAELEQWLVDEMSHASCVDDECSVAREYAARLRKAEGRPAALPADCERTERGVRTSQFDYAIGKSGEFVHIDAVSNGFRCGMHRVEVLLALLASQAPKGGVRERTPTPVAPEPTDARVKGQRPSDARLFVEDVVRALQKYARPEPGSTYGELVERGEALCNAWDAEGRPASLLEGWSVDGVGAWQRWTGGLDRRAWIVGGRLHIGEANIPTDVARALLAAEARGGR